MAAQPGKDVLLKIDTTGGGVFATIGGIRSNSLALNKETVDITSADSVNRWRELLAGAGVKSASVSGSGVFKDDSNDALVRNSFMNDTLLDWQLIVPDFGTFEGGFMITALEYAGEQNGETTFSISLESGNEITFTAA